MCYPSVNVFTTFVVGNITKLHLSHFFFFPHSIVARVVALFHCFPADALPPAISVEMQEAHLLVSQLPTVSEAKSQDVSRHLGYCSSFPGHVNTLFFCIHFLRTPQGISPLSNGINQAKRSWEKKDLIALVLQAALRKTSKNIQGGGCYTAPKQGPILTPLLVMCVTDVLPD